jgi:hypothetical protein
VSRKFHQALLSLQFKCGIRFPVNEIMDSIILRSEALFLIAQSEGMHRPFMPAHACWSSRQHSIS